MKELENKLEQKEVRPTAMRLLVLETLQKRTAAMSLQDLEDAFEKADRITLYRTLKTFQEKGLIHSIEDGTGATKYALCQEGCQCAPEDKHVHFYCNSCEDTFCLPDFRIPQVPLPENFSAEETRLLEKGTCASCSS